mmetsp:Transcript_14959/g.21237  ORF Transcript_14959/g.21237 Transcript_14959/m.21237 type:complete len:138 (-) Transcript_14959:308-721(-)
MGNACSVESRIIDGRLSTTRVDKECLRKLVKTDSTIFLTSNGSKLEMDQHYTVSDASELDQVQVGTSTMIQVIVSDVGGPACHENIRKMEEATIAKIQEKAKENPSQLISTEDSVYHREDVSLASTHSWSNDKCIHH